jgi:hypothetical protein
LGKEFLQGEGRNAGYFSPGVRARVAPKTAFKASIVHQFQDAAGGAGLPDYVDWQWARLRPERGFTLANGGSAATKPVTSMPLTRTNRSTWPHSRGHFDQGPLEAARCGLQFIIWKSEHETRHSHHQTIQAR